MQPNSNDEKSDVILTKPDIKTTSLEVLLTGDRRLLEAHQAAVNRTLISLEQQKARLASESEDEKC